MATSFELKLVTPTGVVFQGAVDEVTANGQLGEFGVLAEHINFITSLVPGLLRIRKADGSTESWVVSGGLAEVKEGAMTVLANGAETPESIDRAAAETQEKAAEEKIATMSEYDPDYAAAAEEAMLARARVRAASPASRASH